MSDVDASRSAREDVVCCVTVSAPALVSDIDASRSTREDIVRQYPRFCSCASVRCRRQQIDKEGRRVPYRHFCSYLSLPRCSLLLLATRRLRLLLVVP
ncbi:hypothetical protein HN51_026441 [Arachis hypogaea]